jgi:DNA ligase (NAD+)
MTIEIEIPTTCPSCDSVLEKVNSQLFCRNTECPAQSTKKVEAFVKKMRIKGLGPARISTLDFVKPLEIYETNLETYINILGEKVGQKIYDEVDNSTLTTFATFISALSIPLIGDTASKKIAAEGFASVLDILDKEYVDNIGPKAQENLFNYIQYNQEELVKLENWFTFGLVAPKVVQDQGNVCITGKLNDFSNRTKAKEFLEDHGYTVTTTISGKTDYLVCEDSSNSSKSKKAESLGVPIVTIADLI